MFNFFSKANISHSAKKVAKWSNEHRKLEELAGKIVAAYETEDYKASRKHLCKLQNIALKHLMDEDVTFFELMKNTDEKDQRIIDSIKEFRKSFVDTKKALIRFFIIYTNPVNPLDARFKTTLDVIIDALVNRIEFEENNLYVLINK